MSPIVAKIANRCSAGYLNWRGSCVATRGSRDVSFFDVKTVLRFLWLWRDLLCFPRTVVDTLKGTRTYSVRLECFRLSA